MIYTHLLNRGGLGVKSPMGRSNRQPLPSPAANVIRMDQSAAM